MKGIDKEEEQWLQAFMPLYEQAAPLIQASATLDADGLPGDLKSLLEAGGKLLPILQSVKNMRKPKRKELRNIKKDFERALSICLKASESAGKFVAAEVRDDPEIAKRMRFGTMVGQTQLVASCYEQLSESMVKVGAALGKKKTDYRKAAFDMYLDNIYKAAGNQFEYSQWYSWGVGADAIFKGLKNTPGCEMAPDSLDKAKLLLEVGIQAMISLWYHNWESQESHSDEEKEMTRKISLGNVQTFLGISSKDSINLYLGFDRELQECLSGESRDPDKLKLPGTYIAMFCERCWECVTGEQIVDWSKLQLPTESYEEFVNACHKGKQHGDYHPLNTLRIWGVIMTSSKPMFDTFTRMRKKRNK